MPENIDSVLFSVLLNRYSADRKIAGFLKVGSVKELV